MSERARRIAVAAALMLAAGWVWAGVHAGSREWTLAGLAALASAPAMVRALWPSRATRVAVAAVVLVAVVGCAAIAARRSPFALAGLDAGAWDAVGRIARDGFVESNRAVAPVQWSDAPAFAGLLDVMWALVAASVAGSVVVRGRPAVALATVAAAAAYRWTVAPPAHPVWEGLALVAAGVLALALVREPEGRGLVARGPRGAVALGAGALAAAALAGTALGDDGRWWNWESWGFQGRQGGDVGTLSTAQNYGQLTWPAVPRVVMTVRTPEPLPLAAATLTAFDGASFVDAGAYGIPQSTEPVYSVGGTAAVRAPRVDDPTPVSQTIELRRTTTNLVFAGGHIVSVQGDFANLTLVDGTTLATSPAVGPDFAYRVSVTVPDPDPDRLRAATRYPRDVDPTVREVRPFGGDPAAASGQDAVVPPLFPEGLTAPMINDRLGSYGRVRALAQRVAGDASSPYVAVNRIEAYLRQTYTYDEKPPPDRGQAPLAAFLFTNKRGFCQHFAGSMALMLRTIGIPSRVVVGYAPGHFDVSSGTWQVVDRDAHAWVEAYLPDAGWVAFDPTPGRYYPNRVSVGSPDYAPPRSTGDPGDDVAANPVRIPEGARPSRPEPATGDPEPVDVPVAGGGGVPWWLWAALGAAAAAVAAGSVAPLRRA
ncbi:MAG: transglutaminase domain-containing protein, partial [Thermoleophilia bacterium]|nr:transglutaminase domain-containing protein [Thermoleophilia bacterium]